jgi:cold shock CspA family protein
MATGTVREWYDDEGWGVLDSDATPGGCFAHYSSVEADGYRRLRAGERVRFAWVAADQDGYSFRAEAVWSAGVEPNPLVPAPTGPQVESAPGWYAYVPDPVAAAHEGLVHAAGRRADALVSGDVENLLHLLHPEFTWTSHRGDVLDRESYVRGNTDGSLVWLAQRLEDVRTIVAGETGVLTATAHDRVRCDGQELTFVMPLTQVWVETDRDHQCLAGHAGPLIS